MMMMLMLMMMMTMTRMLTMRFIGNHHERHHGSEFQHLVGTALLCLTSPPDSC